MASEKTFSEWQDTLNTVLYDASRQGHVCYEARGWKYALQQSFACGGARGPGGGECRPISSPAVVYKRPNDSLAGLTGVHVSVAADFVDANAVGADMEKAGLSRAGINMKPDEQRMMNMPPDRKSQFRCVPLLALFLIVWQGPYLLARADAATTTWNVRDGGAKGDGKTLDTVPIQKAIDDCSSKGGGTVVFPAGNYLIGTIYLKSNITLSVQANAEIVGTTHLD